MKEQGELYLKIINEDGGRWLSHMPEKYWTKRWVLPVREGIPVIFFSLLFMVCWGVYDPLGFEAGPEVLFGLILAALIIYMTVRSKLAQKAYVATREPLLLKAHAAAEAYLSRRFKEEGVDVRALRDWVRANEDEAKLIIELRSKSRLSV